MNTLEIESGPFAAFVCLLLFLVLAVKYPTGLAFSFMTTKAFGWAPVLGLVNFAKTLFALQFLAIIYLLIMALKGGAIGRLNFFFRRRESALAWVLILLWLKVIVDIFLGGLNPDRIGSLKIAPVQVFFPAVIIVLGFAAYPAERVLRGVFWGMLLFPMACIIPAMPGVIEGHRIALALQGTERFAIWGLDTIQGGQFFCYAALGALGLSLMAPGKMAWLKPIGWGVFAACFFFLTINATRQFLLACIIGMVVSIALNFRRNIWVALCAGLFFFLAASFILGKVTDSAVNVRVSSDAISGEVASSRGVIWRDAFITGAKSPVLGAGFRNFGEVVTVRSDLTGETQMIKDTAHGFFQEVWAEHGMFLGLCAIFAALWSVSIILRRAIANRDLVFYALFFLNISLLFTCLFSGTIYSSAAPYILAVSMLGLTGPLPQVNVRLNTRPWPKKGNPPGPVAVPEANVT